MIFPVVALIAMTELAFASSIIGHRGYPDKFPENSMAGFEAALSVADGVELDLRLTSDNKVQGTRKNLSDDRYVLGHRYA